MREAKALALSSMNHGACFVVFTVITQKGTLSRAYPGFPRSSGLLARAAGGCHSPTGAWREVHQGPPSWAHSPKGRTPPLRLVNPHDVCRDRRSNHPLDVRLVDIHEEASCA